MKVLWTLLFLLSTSISMAHAQFSVGNSGARAAVHVSQAITAGGIVVAQVEDWGTWPSNLSLWGVLDLHEDAGVGKAARLYPAEGVKCDITSFAEARWDYVGSNGAINPKIEAHFEYTGDAEEPATAPPDICFFSKASSGTEIFRSFVLPTSSVPIQVASLLTISGSYSSDSPWSIDRAARLVAYSGDSMMMATWLPTHLNQNNTLGAWRVQWNLRSIGLHPYGGQAIIESPNFTMNKTTYYLVQPGQALLTRANVSGVPNPFGGMTPPPNPLWLNYQGFYPVACNQQGSGTPRDWYGSFSGTVKVVPYLIVESS